MLGAIFIGLSGLSAYSRGLKTISNNVANLNTPGFKASSVRFTDAFTGAANGQRYAGGLGSAFSGGGVRYDQATLDFGSGELRATGNDLDLAVSGRGMLVLLDGDRTYFTRTASFKVDEDGYIVDEASGHRLAVLDGSGRATAVNIDNKLVREPEPTTKITFAKNLSTDSTSALVDNITVYDANGGVHVWKATLTPVTGSTDWKIDVTEGATNIGTFTLKFLTGGIPDPSSSIFTATLDPAQADATSIQLDFSSITHWTQGTTSTLATDKVDGAAVSELATITVKDGKLLLTYANDKTDDLGALAVADFLNPQDLEQLGNGLYENRKNLSYRLLGANDTKIGKAVGGQIEASNVDLSQEFGDLILVQRGYQASSQVVSVSNDMIQQLFGIRGQG